ncbi:hypothetical protein K1719_016074 [Acacia pycnantha]|nr:hypothetical protein K1719_016074 [Acacia pycnantha]
MANALNPVASSSHSTDSLRSTKKVRILSDGMQGSMDGGSEGSEGVDVRMIETNNPVGDSYRSKLLSMGKASSDNNAKAEVVVSEGDYLIGCDGDISSIDFSKEVREVLEKGMERALVIKLLGRSVTYVDLMNRTQSIWKLKGSYQLVDMEANFYFAMFDLEEDYVKVLTGGPWTIFGAYITLQPWTSDFNPNTTSISTVVAWVQVPGLALRYYHKSTLRAIGKLLGEVVKIDYMTESRGRGKYARVAVLTDLQKPLIPWIKVDGKIYGVEYEGLPLICFSCGKYGHTKEKCQGASLVNCAHASGVPDPRATGVSGDQNPTMGRGSSGNCRPEPGWYGWWARGKKENVRGAQGLNAGPMGKLEAPGSVKAGSNKMKSGATKSAQVYRKKVSTSDPISHASGEVHKALMEQPSGHVVPPSSGVVDNVGVSMAQVSPIPSVSVGTCSEITTPMSSAFKAVETESTLD